MTRSPRASARSTDPPRGHYRLRLFIAGSGPNSRQALVNLRELCQKHLKGRHTIEIIDVVKNFEAAIEDNILVTPALILVLPRPRVVVLGNLSDSRKVLLALRLPEGDS
jgi:circadian clock protein KaiB